MLRIIFISAIFMPISIMAAEPPTNPKDGDTYTNDRGIPFEYGPYGSF